MTYFVSQNSEYSILEFIIKIKIEYTINTNNYLLFNAKAMRKN